MPINGDEGGECRFDSWNDGATDYFFVSDGLLFSRTSSGILSDHKTHNSGRYVVRMAYGTVHAVEKSGAGSCTPTRHR